MNAMKPRRDLLSRVKEGPANRLELSTGSRLRLPPDIPTQTEPSWIANLGSYRKVKTGLKVRSSYVSKTQQRHNSTNTVHTLPAAAGCCCTGSRKRHSSGHPQELAHRCCSSQESSLDEKSPWISTIQTSIVFLRYA